MIRTILVLIIVGTIVGSAWSQQTVEDGWKGLLPLKSSKGDVEKLFGLGVRTKERDWYQYEYNTDLALVRVDFTGEPCDLNTHPIERFNLPASTILRYEVRLKRAVPLTAFSFDKYRFDRDATILGPNNEPRAVAYLQYDSDLRQLPSEWSAGNGIEIWVSDVENTEVVTGFFYGIPYDKAKFKCPEN